MNTATYYDQLYGYNGEQGKAGPWHHGAYVLMRILRQYINKPGNFREWTQTMKEITNDVIEHGRKKSYFFKFNLY